MSASGVRCAARTSRGYGCLNPAKDGPYCVGHDLRNQCQAPLAKGGRCRRRSTENGCYCTFHAAR